MRLSLVLLALLACAAATGAEQALLDGACEFASTSRGVLAVSEQVSRVSNLANPVKFLFDNKKCTDFMLCVEDSSLSGGSGCLVTGARSESTNMCSLKGTNRGDDTYMLALQDPTCKGMDLVNCLSVSVQGSTLEITQTCAAKIGAITFTCLGCQPVTTPAGSAVVAVAQDGPVGAQHIKQCDKYGWCGTCNCPPIPPPPDNKKTCNAACAGKSVCSPIDNTLCKKLDTKTCTVKDNTECQLTCEKPPSTAVLCNGVRAKAVLVFEKQDEDGNWIVQNVNGENPYEMRKYPKDCPKGPECTGTPDALCKAYKTGSCTPVSSGACTCQKDGFCDVQAGPARTEVVTCPSQGGTPFYPCDGGCKPQYIPIPCDKDKDKDKYLPGTKPYPPDFGYPKDGYGYPKDGYGYPKDGYGYPHNN